MSKNDKNFPTSQSPKDSQNNPDELFDDRERDVKIEIADHRDHGFFIIDNLFVDSCFDIYTMAYYMRIVRRAHRSEQGFFEYQKTTCAALGISQSKLRRCNALLAFCNVIKIQHRKNPKNPKMLMSSKITLVDQKKWKLDHKFRDAEVFASAKRVPLSPEKKFKLLESKIKKQENSKGAVQNTAGGGAVQNTAGCGTEYPRVRYMRPSNEEEPNEQKTLLKNDAVENFTKEEEISTTASKNEISLKEEKSYKPNKPKFVKMKSGMSFKGAKSWEERTDDDKKEMLLQLACNAHRRGTRINITQCPPFDFFQFPTVLKPFFENNPLDLLYNFYLYAEKTGAPINVLKSNEMLNNYQEIIKNQEIKPEEPKKEANEEVEFGELSEDIRTYAQNLTEKKKEIIRKIIEKSGNFAANIKLRTWFDAAHRKETLEKRFSQQAAI